MTAVGLIFGELTAAHYEDKAASDPRIDALRSRMVVAEDPGYSSDYLDPGKRSIANAVQVFFTDGTRTEKVAVEYPLGHRRRRAEGIPLLKAKASAALAGHFGHARAQEIMLLFSERARVEALPVHEFMGLLAG